MEELIVSSDELKQLFKDKKLLDTNDGWFLNGKEIEIIAIHKIEVKHVMDMTRADFYKLVEVKR